MSSPITTSWSGPSPRAPELRPMPRETDGGTDPLAALVARALEEDRYRHDRTTRAVVPRHVAARGVICAQARGVLSGLGAVALAARKTGLTVHARARDGETVRPGQVVLTVSGDARTILAAERTLLNVLMH